MSDDIPREQLEDYINGWTQADAKKPVRKARRVLETNNEGRPIINLHDIKDTAVHTRTQADYNTLMRTYECAEWQWGSTGAKPTEINVWSMEQGETRVRAHDEFSWGLVADFQELSCRILTLSDFYKKQNVTEDMLDQINTYYEGLK